MDFSFVFTQRPPPIIEPPTHFRALNVKVSKTNQDGGFGCFIDEYFVYKVFCQERKNNNFM
jgi:hypothetical protein